MRLLNYSTRPTEKWYRLKRRLSSARIYPLTPAIFNREYPDLIDPENDQNMTNTANIVEDKLQPSTSKNSGEIAKLQALETSLQDISPLPTASATISKANERKVVRKKQIFWKKNLKDRKTIK